MKDLKLKLNSNFELEILEQSNIYKLENNSTTMTIVCEVEDNLTYRIHVSHGEREFFIPLEREGENLTALLNSGFLKCSGTYYMQIEGYKEENEYSQRSNKVRLMIDNSINGDFQPTPEEQRVLEHLEQKVDELDTEVSAIDNRVDSISHDILNVKNNVETLSEMVGEFASDLETEQADRIKADALLEGDIQFESDERKAEDLKLDKKISTVAEDLSYLDEFVNEGFGAQDRNHVSYVAHQGKDDARKQIARENIDAASVADIQRVESAVADKADKSDVDSKVSKEEYENSRDLYVKNGLVDNSLELTDEEKLAVEEWLGLAETYLTTYNETPYQVNGNYNPAHKKYVDEAIAPLEEKIDDLQLFKFPNATIFGEPTINNGQISGFSTTSYLKFPFLVDFNNRPFEINMEFTTGSNVVNQENIFDSDFGLAFAIRNRKFVIAVSSNGTSWNLGEGVGTYTVLPNTTYRVKLWWDRMTYHLSYSTNGGVSYTEDITKVGAFQPAPKQMYIGVGENFAEVFNYFTGIINMNHCNLSILGQVIWQGMDDAGLATRLEIDLSNIDQAGIDKIKEIAGAGDVTKEYLEENYYDKPFINNWDTLVVNPSYEEVNILEEADVNALIDAKINALDARGVSY